MKNRKPILPLFPILSVFFPALLVLLLLLVKRPYYGLMDDASLLQGAIPRAFGPSLLGYWFQQSLLDIQSGFFRFLYQPMIWLFYSFFQSSPLYLFGLNFLIASFSIFFFTYTFVRAIEPHPSQARSVFSLAILVTFSVPWMHDLFVHPSLQEKLILIAAAISFLTLPRWAHQWSVPKFLLGAFLVLGIGSATKAQFVIFFPALTLLVALNDPKRAKPKAMGTLVLAGIFTFFLAWVAHHGRYTGGVKFEWHHFFQSKLKLMILGFAVLGCIAPGVAFFKNRDFLKMLRTCLPALTLFSFLAVFFSWNLVGYLVSLVAPVVGVLVSILIHQFSEKIKKVAFLSCLPIAMAISFWRSDLYFQKLADIRNLILNKEFISLTTSGLPLYINCLEGKISFHYYTQKLAGQKIQVQELFERSEEQKKFLLIQDTKLCPAALDPNRFQKKPIISPSGLRSFELIEVEAR